MPVTKTFEEKIARLAQSTCADFSHLALSQEDLKKLVNALKDYPSIHTLNLTGCQLKDSMMAWLSSLSQINGLILSSNMLTDLTAERLIHMPSLVTLNLSFNGITDVGVSCLAKHPTLTTLVLNGNTITAKGMAQLIDNKCLQCLSLVGNTIDSTSMSLLPRNTSLQKLYLDNNYICDEDIKIIVSKLFLAELSLSYNNITSEGLIFLSEGFQGHTVNLANNYINGTGVRALLKNSSLNYVDLSHNKTGSEGLHGIEDNTVLRWLDISYNQLDDEAIALLAKNTSLTYLNISCNNFNKQSIAFFSRNISLKSLVVNYSSLDDEVIEQLSKNKSITCLALTGNSIGSKGAEALSKMEKLHTLYLICNMVSDEGAVFLAQSKSLKSVYLNYNYIKDVGAKALIENKNIESLHLNYNPIQEARGLSVCLSEGRDVILPDRYVTGITKDILRNVFLLPKSIFCVLNEQTRVVFFNSFFVDVVGGDSAELFDCKLLNFIHPEDSDLMIRILAQEKSEDTLIRLLSKEGGFHVINWNSQKQNNLIYLAGFDLNLQKKAEGILKKLLENEIAQAKAFVLKQTEFIAHLCHEIRNPLSGIYGLIELLVDKMKSIETFMTVLEKKQKTEQEVAQAMAKIQRCKEDALVALADIRVCCRYEEDILNDNLDMARIYEKRLMLNEQPMSMNQILSDVLVMTQAKAEDKGLVLQSNVSAIPEYWVKADAMRIKQIVLNLVNNAIKFTSSGSVSVELDLKDQINRDSYFTIRVKDTGMGIKNEEINVLFNSYAQANLSIGSQYGGSGLGLYIAKQLAQLMKGDLTVKSEVNKGTEFTCTLVCQILTAEEKAQFLMSSKGASEMTSSALGSRVLVVEDNEINVKVLCFLLKSFGCQYRVARDGVEGVETYKEYCKQLDMVLMDTYMPKKNGLEAIKEIRTFEQQQNLPRKPIISLSGNALEADKALALEAGADEYLTKPYKKEQLWSEMHELISKSYGNRSPGGERGGRLQEVKASEADPMFEKYTTISMP